ncbi:aspartic peptidase domain-containing protein [Xylariales sp. PMI_506]|nr:aspartic peptidase domain-containing protein [Xylariales sp. PMI_506]
MAKQALRVGACALAIQLGTAAVLDNDLRRTANFLAEAGLSSTDNVHALDLMPFDPKMLQQSRFWTENPEESRGSLYGGEGIQARQVVGTDVLRPIPPQVQYLMNVGVGKKAFNMIPDTGSADIWLAESNFTCVDRQYNVQSQAACQLQATYSGTFSGGKINNEHLNISYGGGDSLIGDLGYADVTVAGITVKNQEISLITEASLEGNGYFSGILGLGLPQLTSAFEGTNPAADGDSSRVIYSPIVVTMSNNTPVAPIFSMAMSRTVGRSYISFGGVPAQVRTGPFSVAPIEKAYLGGGKYDYLFYAIRPDSVTYSNNKQHGNWSQPAVMIVDSGTTLNYFPSSVADDIAKMWTPAAQYAGDGTYFARCDGVAPSIQIGIGGGKFTITPSSLIFPESAQPGPDGHQWCSTGIARASGDNYILGDVFMQELLVVFDVSANKRLFFAQRTA